MSQTPPTPGSGAVDPYQLGPIRSFMVKLVRFIRGQDLTHGDDFNRWADEQEDRVPGLIIFGPGRKLR